jgi:hypothetical protein
MSARRIEARNLAAQLHYAGRGSPPSSHPSSAISNAYPGLEMDFRNVWKHIFAGIELHESSNLVVAVEPGCDELAVLATGYRLIGVNAQPVTMTVVGPPKTGGPPAPLPDTTCNETAMPLEWSNALAAILHQAEPRIRGTFQSITDHSVTLEFWLQRREFFDREPSGDGGLRAAIAKPLAAPGELSQSFCSPWQNDYRECACFYWASNRPDFVNVEARTGGTAGGHNWMQRDRTTETPKTYIVDDWQDPRLVTHLELFTEWEKALRFVIGGEDEPPVK